MINIVLVEPEIPANAGNIARTCAASGTRLHMVRPFGFSLDDRQLKRAGLDYWHLLDIRYYDSFAEVAAAAEPGAKFYFASTKGGAVYSDVRFAGGDYIVFGKETKGLPEELLRENYENCIRIPMAEGARSLNLSNSVAIVLYEALRQTGFSDMRLHGALRGMDF